MEGSERLRRRRKPGKNKEGSKEESAPKRGRGNRGRLQPVC